MNTKPEEKKPDAPQKGKQKKLEEDLVRPTISPRANVPRAKRIKNSRKIFNCS